MLQPRQSPVVRRATPADLDCLPAIERSADQAFRDAGVSLGEDISASPAETWQGALRAGTLWVACNESDRIVGFLAARKINRVLHIDEVDVAFDHQRRGFGRALLGAATDWARRAGLREITLTTFRDVAFNRNFYAASGFVEVAPEQLSERLAGVLAREADAGFDAKQRCGMVLRLQPGRTKQQARR
jgi:GNAT superfamily N-acetyltransferase